MCDWIKKPFLIFATRKGLSAAESQASIGKPKWKVALELEVPELPESMKAGAELDAIIHIETLLECVLRWPARFRRSQLRTSRFSSSTPTATKAIRVKVRVRTWQSVNTIQIRHGLAPDDRIILSDMSGYSNYDRIVVQE